MQHDFTRKKSPSAQSVSGNTPKVSVASNSVKAERSSISKSEYPSGIATECRKFKRYPFTIAGSAKVSVWALCQPWTRRTV